MEKIGADMANTSVSARESHACRVSSSTAGTTTCQNPRLTCEALEMDSVMASGALTFLPLESVAKVVSPRSIPITPLALGGIGRTVSGTSQRMEMVHRSASALTVDATTRPVQRRASVHATAPITRDVNPPLLTADFPCFEGGRIVMLGFEVGVRCRCSEEVLKGVMGMPKWLLVRVAGDLAHEGEVTIDAGTEGFLQLLPPRLASVAIVLLPMVEGPIPELNVHILQLSERGRAGQEWDGVQ